MNKVNNKKFRDFVEKHVNGGLVVHFFLEGFVIETDDIRLVKGHITANEYLGSSFYELKTLKNVYVVPDEKVVVNKRGIKIKPKESFMDIPDLSSPLFAGPYEKAHNFFSEFKDMEVFDLFVVPPVIYRSNDTFIGIRNGEEYYISRRLFDERPNGNAFGYSINPSLLKTILSMEAKRFGVAERHIVFIDEDERLFINGVHKILAARLNVSRDHETNTGHAQFGIKKFELIFERERTIWKPKGWV